MAGLTLWLDGSKGVVEDPVKPGKIFKWQDRSGKSNDATVASTESPAIQAGAVNGKGAVNCDSGSYLSVKDADNTFALYIARGKKMEVRAGGKTGTGPTTTIDVNDTNPAFICRGTTDNPAAIAELMVVKGTLSDADIAQATKYVKNKYGF